jgi:hypothetical protein
MKKNARPVNAKKMYAYFAPDGYIQVRSIAGTKKLSREMISKFKDKTWVDYERKGYFLSQVDVTILPLNR